MWLFQQNWEVLNTCFQQKRNIFASKHEAFSDPGICSLPNDYRPWRWEHQFLLGNGLSHLGESPHLLCLSRGRESPKIVRKELPTAVPKKPPIAWLRVGFPFVLEEDIILSIKPSFQDQQDELCIAYASSKTLAPSGTKMKSQPQPIFSCTKSMGCWQCHM